MFSEIVGQLRMPDTLSFKIRRKCASMIVTQQPDGWRGGEKKRKQYSRGAKRQNQHKQFFQLYERISNRGKNPSSVSKKNGAMCAPQTAFQSGIAPG